MQGWAEAELNLGYCYELGKGVQQDLGQAVVWYWYAANHGNATAMYNLASCYEYGKGIQKNHDQAVLWISYSSMYGFEPAIEVMNQLNNGGTEIPDIVGSMDK